MRPKTSDHKNKSHLPILFQLFFNDFYFNVVLAKTSKTHQTSNSELYPHTEQVKKK